MRGLLLLLLALAPTSASAALSPGSGRTGAGFLRIGVGLELQSAMRCVPIEMGEPRADAVDERHGSLPIDPATLA